MNSPMNSLDFIDDQLELSTLCIEAERIRLVPASESFANDIFCEFSNDITTYMMPKAATDISETLEFLHHSAEARQAKTELIFAICKKGETAEFLGMCGLHGRDSMLEPELGIWLKKSAHGNGYGREAIQTLMRWAQDNVQLEAFIYPVDKRNIPSRKIPEALGGVIIMEKQEINRSGNLLDEVVYRIAV